MENNIQETNDSDKKIIAEEDFIVISIDGRMKTTTKDIKQENDIELEV